MDKIELPDGTIIGEGGKSKKPFNFALLFSFIGAIFTGFIVYFNFIELGLIYAGELETYYYSTSARGTYTPPYETTKIAHAVFYGMAFFCLAYFIPALRKTKNIVFSFSDGKTTTAQKNVWRALFIALFFGLLFLIGFRPHYITEGNVFHRMIEYGVPRHIMFFIYHAGWAVFPLLSFGLITASSREVYLRNMGRVLALFIAYKGLDYIYDGLEGDGLARLLIAFLAPVLLISGLYFKVTEETKNKKNAARTKARAMQNQATALHGDARYASLKELAQYGMINAEGYNFNGNFLLGNYYENRADGTYNEFPVYSEGDEHIITFAKARAGKGISSIIPNLLGYEGSILTIDPKGENAAVTARSRRDNLGQKVYLLNPFEMHKEHFKECGFEEISHGFNPLKAVHRNDLNGISMAKQIAQTLVPDKPKANDDFWSNRSRGLVYSIILYLAYHREEKDCNLDTLYETLSLPAEELQSLFEDLREEGHNRAVKGAAGRFLSIKSDKTQGSIIGGAQAALEFMDLEQMAMVTGRHDFDLSDLKNDKVTIYLILPVEHLETCAAWLRLMVNLTLATMSEVTTVPEKPVLLLLDEAARLGRIEKLASAPAALSGYGVRVWPIFQGMGQIQHLYKDEEWRDFISNSTVQLFGVNDSKTAKYFSEHMGKYGVVIESYNEGASHNDSGMKGASAGSSQGSSLGVHGRALMTPDEILRMENHEQLILMASKRPARIGKIKYFEMPKFFGSFDKNPYFKG